MTLTERRLWIGAFVLFIISLTVSFALSVAQGTKPELFFKTKLENVRTAIRPEKEARRIERVLSLKDIQTLSVVTGSAQIRVSRNDDRQDAALTLEGRFFKSLANPLVIERNGDAIRVRAAENLERLSWMSVFEETSRNTDLTLVLPRQWAGKLSLTTESGSAEVHGLSLGEFDWKSESGSLEVSGGEMHIAHLESVSGEIAYDSNTIDCRLDAHRGDTMLTLRGLEQVVAPRIDLQTESGRLDVAVPEAASLRISLSSLTGPTTSTVPLEKSMRGQGGALEGRLGAGGGELRLRSVSGPVHLSTFSGQSHDP